MSQPSSIDRVFALINMHGSRVHKLYLAARDGGPRKRSPYQALSEVEHQLADEPPPKGWAERQARNKWAMGTCPCCEESWKVRANKPQLPFHADHREGGQQRQDPSWPNRQRQCFGSMCPPHEVSAQTATGYAETLERQIAWYKEQLAVPSRLAEYHQDDFARQLALSERELARVSKLVGSWQPLSLAEVAAKGKNR